MKALNVVSCAYRATSEEQDDTIVWLVGTLRNGGADVELLLCGNSVNYCVAAQQPVPVEIGASVQRNPPDPAGDLARFIAKGGRVYVIAEDLAARGIIPPDLIADVQLLGRGALPALYERYDRVWSW